MVAKLNRLPVETVNALKRLACLGNSAEFALLALAYEVSGEELHSDLQEALRTGLVLHSEGAYRFLHDRVQEAAYSLIPEDLRAEAHLRIGRLLVEHTSREKREEAIFEIVNQLNRGAALITSQDEREQLAELNLIAGKRAKASTAYASALNYLVGGAALLPDDCWERRPELILALELHRAECEFLTGEPATAEARLTMLSSRAANAIDQATIACLRVDLYTTLDRSDRAVDVCLAYLRHLGIDWSPHPPEELARREYERTWSLLGSRAIEELVDLPLMSDALSLATQDVLTKVVPPALFTDRNLLSLVICRMVNLSLEYGNSDGSCFAYVFLGMIAGPHFDNYEGGFQFGQLGYALVEKHSLHRYRARTYMAFGSFVMPWTRHVRTGRDLVRRAFDVANRIGDLTFGAYSCNNLNTNLLAAGDALAETQGEAEQGLEFAHKARFGLVIAIITVQLQLIRTLRGLTPAFGCFDDEQFEERRFEHDLASQADLALAECWYWIRKLQARVLAGDYRSAIDASSKARPLLWTSPSFFETAEYEFYSGLCRAALCDCTLADERLNHFEALAAHYRQLEVWAANCPENFENRTALVGAEIARLEGRELDAEHLYEKAIRSADANGFVHNVALANELAARFYAARGFEKIANAYLQDARYGYLRWGANGKVKQLDHLYPHLGEESPAHGSTSTAMAPVEPLAYPHLKNEPDPGPTSTIVASVELLDLATVIKVSQAVSGEMVLEKLMDRLMRAAIEHAGAERGLLIVPRGDTLQMEAEATIGGQGVTVHLRDGTPVPAALPESLVRYAMRTREIVILDDASVQTPFSADPYIVQSRAHSILCLPLVNQTKLIGILYLENNLTPYVFTPGRVTVLKVLASQAAISLENTRLYGDLEDREARIRRLVEANVVGVVMWTLDGAIIEANEAFLHMVQYGHEDLASGRVRWRDLTPAEWRDCDERAVADLKATGAFQPFEKEYFRKNGSRVPVLVAGALFEGSRNEGVAFVVDLSEQKRAEQERERLRQLEAELAHINRVSTLGEMAASLAHEIKQPIAAAITSANSCLEWLAHEPPNLDRARAAAARIDKYGNRAAEIIDRIRSFYKKSPPQRELVDVNGIVEEMLTLLKGEANRYLVAMRTELAADLPKIMADRVQLQQVFMNLMLNAMEAMKDSGGELTVKSELQDGRLQFSVSDTGVGLPMEKKDQMFSAFFTTKPQGSGMGLAITRSIVESHGGQLWASGNSGGGATFNFTLPIQATESSPLVA
jgi:PAS domain S-box-containing protein